MNRLLLATLLLCFAVHASADVVITEFLANNSSGLVDENGDYSDWIEVYNNGGTPVNLQNWRLTDDQADKAKWIFPSTTLGANSYLVVFASNKDRRVAGSPLHTNFKLGAAGGYLALIRPDLSVSSQFNPYPAQYPDKSYGFAQTEILVSSSAPLKWLVPANNNLGTGWTNRTFDDSSWTAGTNAVGFDTSSAGWQVRTVFANLDVSSALIAEGVLTNASQQVSSSTVTHAVLNWNNSSSPGHYTPENPPPALNTATDLDRYVVEGTGVITIPSAGTWSFCVTSDDGCLLQVRPIGGTYVTVIGDPGLRGMQDSVGSVSFPAAGSYEIRALIYENGGGSGGEVSARAGSFTAWSSDFKLIGDTANGGLVVRPTASYATLIATNLASSMVNAAVKKSSAFLRYSFSVTDPATVNALTLAMQYDDGFIAYLNGQIVARRNVAEGTLNYDAVASGSRTYAQVLPGENIDLTAFKSQLIQGTNVLAIHGLNSAATDQDFLMRPQLIQTISSGTLAYFNVMTPGAPNSTSVYNRVAPVVASVGHGFYTTSQSVQLTTSTPGATIYYTYDGSVPSATNPAAASGSSPVNLTINSTRVLRTMAAKAGIDSSEVTTTTYLFLSDVITQSANGAAPVFSNPPGATQATTTWPAGSVNGQVLNYGMDPDIVTSPLYSGTIVNDLKSIPTISVVTDKDNLFHAAYGIYVNPGQDGNNPDPNNPDPNAPSNWERRASIELINPDGTEGFQANCGLRLRGGFSRDVNNPKHAFRIFFRDEYGLSKLSYDLHKNSPGGNTGAKSFKKFDLRSSQNYSWAFQGDRGNGILVRDEVARDMQLATGQPSSRGGIYHLYLNGQYWGLYNIDERPEANFGESYFGGDADDYDTIKIDPDNGYNVEATDGDTQAWQALWQLADQTLPQGATEAARNGIYQRMKGRNADGTVNGVFPVYLDDVGTIDSMLVVYYGGNLDAPISEFLGNASPNNMYIVRNRLGVSGGWKAILHDSEHTLLNVDTDRTGPWGAGAGNFSKSSIQYVFQQLVAQSTDFRALFADRVFKHFYNGGPMSPAGALAIFDRRILEIDRAVVAESARWGDSKTEPPINRNTDWVNAVNTVRNSYIPVRTGKVIQQFRNRGWYPSFDPPTWSIRGGTVEPGTTIVLSLPNGAPGGSAIYYTLDGSDPRLLGGGLSPSAIQYSGPISITASRYIRTRIKAATDWSALDEATFFTTQDFTPLAITEINYNPPPSVAGGADGSDFEFIEFKNTGAVPLDLGGLNFTSGLTYSFPAGTVVQPGQFYLLLRNQAKFASRYPGVSLAAGTFGVMSAGSLDNSGESLTIATFAGSTILSMTYDDASPWPVAADGPGFSLVPKGTVYNTSNGKDWRASAAIYGSPRADDPAVSIPPIVINEVLSNSGVGQKDAIELHNPTAAPVNVGDWWLTDNPGSPQKYRIPAGTTIPAGGYVSFNEDQFNTGTNAFAFSSAGDDAYVFSGNASGQLTGYSHGFEFAGAEQGRSFGRYVNSVGDEQFPRQTATTFGAVNAGPLVGPLVISEIMYNPFPGYDEYIEIRNLTGSAVPLYDPARPANLWRVGGVNYAFPSNQTIAANGIALVVGIAPATFRSKYGIPANVPIYGPYAGTLQDSGERLSLEMPDVPVLNGEGQTVVPYDVIDTVRYNDKAPWPNVADGSGPSLQRTTLTAYADDPNNWFADGVTPGAANSVNTLPVVNFTAPSDGAVFALPANINLTASATDADGSIVKVEYFVDGVKVGESSTGPSYSFTWTATYGIHTIVAKALDNSFGSSSTTARTIYVTQSMTQGLRGEYYPNSSLIGSPTGLRTDGPINFNNGQGWPANLGFPGVNSDQFSVRWSGQLRATVTGSHLFQLTCDDGVRLYINGVLQINNWTSPTSTASKSVSLTAGQLYDLVLEYYDSTGNHNVRLQYFHSSSGGIVDIPISVLYPEGGPIIFTQPVAVSVEQGTTATFTVASSGKNLSYQWRRNGQPIAGATSSTLTLPYPVVGDAGNYSVVVNNVNGFAISNTVALTVNFTDTDNDGMQNAWETANGLNPNSAADATLDSDGDGFNNKAEFLAGTDPRNPQSRPQAAIAKVAGGFTVSFLAQPYRTYSIQARDSLSSGSWVTIQSVAPVSTAQIVTYTDPTGGSTRYYRVATP